MNETLHIISLGAGVQSSTLALMAAHGEITPMPDLAIFADTQAEPESVYKWLNWLETQLPFPVVRVTAGSLTDSVLAMKKTADGRTYSKTDVPFFTRNHNGSRGKIKYRSCTKDYKIRPIVRETRRVIGPDAIRQWRKDNSDDLRIVREYERAQKAKRPAAHPYDAIARIQATALVEQYIGISRDESVRMKPSRDLWIRNRWPLIEAGMTRQNCITWMLENEYPEPPRSSCVYCPYHNDAEWQRLKTDEPDEFQKAVEFEIALQKGKAASNKFRTTPYLHRSLQTLESVDFSTLAERNGQINLFENECEGMCGN